MKDVTCPYCGHQFDICHDDGHGYAEDRLHEDTCPQCEKNFVFTSYVSSLSSAYPCPSSWQISNWCPQYGQVTSFMAFS